MQAIDDQSNIALLKEDMSDGEVSTPLALSRTPSVLRVDPVDLCASKDARLILADGTVFHGFSFGADVDAEGEVVFNTGMVRI